MDALEILFTEPSTVPCHFARWCHSREGGNPTIWWRRAIIKMDPRLRGDDTKIEHNVQHHLAK
ncbi:Uncharacterised protein [Legionella spiritensis]|nr:Uncharacterised protein [Legionella spiritensis]